MIGLDGVQPWLLLPGCGWAGMACSVLMLRLAGHRLVYEVKAAQAEANDNAAVLKPLRPLFEKLRDLDDFAVLPSLFRPIMHLLLLVWTHSKHYNTATRFVTLMRLICNDLVEQARRAAPGAPYSAFHIPELRSFTPFSLSWRFRLRLVDFQL